MNETCDTDGAAVQCQCRVISPPSIPLLPGDGWLCGALVPALDPARHLEAEHGGDSAFIVTAAPVRVQTPGR